MVERYYESESTGSEDASESSLAKRLIESKKSGKSLLEEAQVISQGIHQSKPGKMSREYAETISDQMDSEADYMFEIYEEFSGKKSYQPK